MSKTDKLLDSGWDLVNDGDVAGARRVGEQVIKDKDAAGDGHLLLAACAREEGDAEAALGHLRDAIATDAEWATPHLWSAEILASMSGRVLEAISSVTRALDLADDEEEFLDAIALKAGLHLGLGAIEAARDTLDQAPPADEEGIPTPVVLELAHLFLAVGDVAEGRARFEEVTKRDAEDADAWHGLGLAADLAGDDATRRRAWLEALRLDVADEDADEMLTDDDATAVIEAAREALAPAVEKALAGATLRVAERPSRDEVEAGRDPRDFVALVAGADAKAAPVLVAFRKNLHRAGDEPDAVIGALAEALLDETARFFAWSEEQIANARG